MSARHWQAQIDVMPKAGVNDPPGDAIRGGLHQLGFTGVRQVRAGKHFVIDLEAPTPEEAEAVASSMADRLLANPVIEQFEVREVRPVDGEDGHE